MWAGSPPSCAVSHRVMSQVIAAATTSAPTMSATSIAVATDTSCASSFSFSAPRACWSSMSFPSAATALAAFGFVSRARNALAASTSPESSKAK